MITKARGPVVVCLWCLAFNGLASTVVIPPPSAVGPDGVSSVVVVAPVFHIASGGDLSARSSFVPAVRSFVQGATDSACYATAAKIGLAEEALTFARTGTADMVADKALTTCTTGTLRENRDGIIVEGAATNLLTSSGDMTTAAWTASHSSVVGGQPAPDGTSSAFRLIDVADGSGHTIYQLGTASGSTAISVGAKAGTKHWLRLMDNGGTHSAYFNLSTGAIGAVTSNTRAEIHPLGLGWYQCDIVATPTTGMYFAASIADADNSGAYTGDGTGTIYLWHPQTATGTYATSWTATTRNADMAYVPFTPPSLTSWCVCAWQWDNGQRTWNSGGHDALFSAGSYSAANTVEGYLTSGSFVFGIWDSTGTGRFTNSNGPAIAQIGPHQFCGCAQGSDGAGPGAYLDGVETSGSRTGTGTGALSAAPTTLQVGGTNSSGAAFLFGQVVTKDICFTYTNDPSPCFANFPQASSYSRAWVAGANRVAVIGDSITDGTCCSITRPYARTLQGTLGPSWAVEKYGVNSETTLGAQRRWLYGLRHAGYGILVVLSGINDVNTGVAPEVTIAHLKQIFDTARADGVRVVPMTLLPGGAPIGNQTRIALDAINAFIRSYGLANKIMIVDLNVTFDDGTGKMKASLDSNGGSLHPNDAGHDLIASLLAAAIPH